MFPKFSVRRPYTVVIFILIIILLGGISLSGMQVDLLPNMNMPYAVVATTYPGATPEEVEQNVTKSVEGAVMSVAGVKEVSSTSQENISIAFVEFNNGTNMDTATIDMREALDQIASSLPSAAGSPMLVKINPAMLPVMSATVSVEGKTPEEASKYIEEEVIPYFESVEGIASVSTTGLIESRYEITVSATFRSMLTAESLNQLGTALQAANFSMPAGSVVGDNASYVVRVGEKFQSKEDVADLLTAVIRTFLSTQKSFIVQGLIDEQGMTDTEAENAFQSLLDGAHLAFDIEETTNADEVYARMDENNAIILMMYKQPDSSTAEVSKGLQQQISKIESKLEGVSVTILVDQGDYINIMVNSIVENLLIGGLLAIIILLVFLRDIKPTFIVSASIVISVLATLVLMYFTGITMNIISMGGLMLAVGMLVDNSIVVIENIYRMRSEGLPRKKAAVYGAQQVAGAVFASTLTTVIIFLPMLFIKNMFTDMILDMGWTIAFSLFASLLVALTLVPMASAGMLRKPAKPETKTFKKVKSVYSKALNWTLNKKAIVLSICTLLFVGSVVGSFFLPLELLPQTEAETVTVTLEFPDHYESNAIYQYMDDGYEQIATVSGVKSVGRLYGSDSDLMSMLGQGGGTMYVLLDKNRKQSSAQIGGQIKDMLSKIDENVEVAVSTEGMDLSMLMGDGLSMEIYAEDLQLLRKTAKDVAAIMGEVNGIDLDELDDGIGKIQKEIQVTIKDEYKGVAFNAQIFQELYAVLGAPKEVTTVGQGGKDVHVYLANNQKYSALNPAPAGTIYIGDYVTTIGKGDGTKFTLGELCDFSAPQDGFAVIKHRNGARYVAVTALVKEGYNVNRVASAFHKKLNEYRKQNAETLDGVRFVDAGENEELTGVFKDLIVILALAVLLIYLVMVGQFQSLLAPFVVMFTIPLAFTGGFIAILCSGTLSVIAFIGLVLLMGIVVNNGIVFVDYANKLVEQGMPRREALIETGKDRMRPILMTALTTIIAMLVMVVDPRSSSAMLKPMAATVVGGLIFATLMTLFVIPCLYEIMIKKRRVYDVEKDDEVAFVAQTTDKTLENQDVKMQEGEKENE